MNVKQQVRNVGKVAGPFRRRSDVMCVAMLHSSLLISKSLLVNKRKRKKFSNPQRSQPSSEIRFQYCLPPLRRYCLHEFTHYLHWNIPSSEPDTASLPLLVPGDPSLFPPRSILCRPLRWIRPAVDPGPVVKGGKNGSRNEIRKVRANKGTRNENRNRLDR